MTIAARPLAFMMMALCLGAGSAPAATSPADPAARGVSPVAKPKTAHPPPPRRPAPAAPVTPRTETPPVAAPAITDAPAVDTSHPPAMLPRAPRERMRACADEWEAKKRATKSGLPLWRDFATECLTR